MHSNLNALDPNRTAVYLRVSSVGQDVRSQRAAIERWLDGHGLEIPPNLWFTDRSTSGKTLDRPAFKQLQRGVFDGQIATVVMYSLDRFARTMIDGLVEIDRWQQMNVRIIFVDNGLDVEPNKYMGEVVLKILLAVQLAFAEAERERIRARQRAGIDAAPQKAARARAMRRDELGIDHIAAELRVRPKTVVRMLKAKPGKLYWGTNGPLGRRCDEKAILRLVGRGLTLGEVAQATGSSTSTVGRVVREHGGVTDVRRLARRKRKAAQELQAQHQSPKT